MPITIVKFRAYDKDCDKAFYMGESFKQIHEKLNEICNTYVLTEILRCGPAENMPLNVINCYKMLAQG